MHSLAFDLSVVLASVNFHSPFLAFVQTDPELDMVFDVAVSVLTKDDHVTYLVFNGTFLERTVTFTEEAGPVPLTSGGSFQDNDTNNEEDRLVQRVTLELENGT